MPSCNYLLSSIILIMEKKKSRHRSGTTAAGFGALLALAATIALALRAYATLPPGSLSTSFGLHEPNEYIPRRMQQIFSAAPAHVSLADATSSATAAGLDWATAGGTLDDAEEFLSVLSYDFEVAHSPLPSVRGLPSTLAFTVAAWVRLQHIASGERCLASHGGPQGRWTLSLSPSGNLKLTVMTNGGGSLHYSAVLAVTLDTWTHVAVGFDGESESYSAGFFINGIRVPHTAPLNISEVRINQCLREEK